MQRLTADGGDKSVLIYKLCPVHTNRVRMMRRINRVYALPFVREAIQWVPF